MVTALFQAEKKNWYTAALMDTFSKTVKEKELILICLRDKTFKSKILKHASGKSLEFL